jgi:hypothetical protein
MDRVTLDAELPHTSLNPVTNEHTNNNGHDGNSVTNVNNNKDGDDDDDDSSDGAVDGPTVEAHVDLAKTACKYHNTILEIYLLTFTVRTVYPEDIAAEIEQPNLPDLIQQFIYNEQHSDHVSDPSASAVPTFYGKITVYPSAVATFHAPSDISGIGGMRRERIRAVKSWRKGPGRYDTIFVNTDSSVEGMRGLEVARVRLFFSFSHGGVKYPCALVHWFSRVGDLPDDRTGMWIVEPDTFDDSEPFTSIIHLDTIVRASHLLPVFGQERVLRTLSFSDTLDTFTRFYVNKHIDHHAFEIAF